MDKTNFSANYITKTVQRLFEKTVHPTAIWQKYNVERKIHYRDNSIVTSSKSNQTKQYIVY